MRKMVPVKNPVLQYFQLIYGKMALHLEASPLQSWSGCFKFGFNVFSIVVFLYMQQQYQNTFRTYEQNQEKPLYGFADSLYWFTYPLTYTCNMLYFLINGPTIMRLLASPCFSKLSLSKGQSKLLFSGFLLFDLSFYYLISGRHVSLWPPTLLTLGWHFLYTVHGFHLLIVFRLVLYAKLATYCSLVALESYLADKKTIVNEQKIAIELAQLARANASFNRLLSLPVLLFFLNYTIGNLVILCFLFTIRIKERYVAFLVVNAINIGCVSLLNRAIQQSLQQIARRFSLLGHIEARKGAFQVKPSLARRLYFIDLYGEHLGFQLFSLFQINNAFLLTVALFIVNYAVLISQTQ